MLDNSTFRELLLIVTVMLAALALVSHLLTLDISEEEKTACKEACKSYAMRTMATTSRYCICAAPGQIKEIPIEEIKDRTDDSK